MDIYTHTTNEPESASDHLSGSVTSGGRSERELTEEEDGHSDVSSQVLAAENDILKIHKARGSTGEFNLQSLTSERLFDTWYFSSASFAENFSTKISGKFETGVLTFKREEDLTHVKQFIETEEESNKIRWKFYIHFLEFKMPESNVHAQTGQEMTFILIEAILNTFYRPGTSRWDSKLRSPATACNTLRRI